jgi:L-ornithine Nalpha-acyltransferase
MTISEFCDNSLLLPQKQTYKIKNTLHPIVLGDLELRLACNSCDIEAAQKLRYQVFYEELGAIPSTATRNWQLDCDEFDEKADHLLVIDRKLENKLTGKKPNPVIGTYRLIQRSHLKNKQTFYTAHEFDITKILSFPGKILELGRSCVDIHYRNNITLRLLWLGIARYVFNFDIDLIFGCASFPGSNPEKHRTALKYLQNWHQAPQDLCPRALPAKYVDMLKNNGTLMVDNWHINNLPPLIKGYLRVGGWVGDGAVIDNQFNTTDVCIIMKTGSIPNRYHKHYQRSFYKSSPIQ